MSNKVLCEKIFELADFTHTKKAALSSEQLSAKIKKCVQTFNMFELESVVSKVMCELTVF